MIVMVLVVVLMMMMVSLYMPQTAFIVPVACCISN
jgi:hypothetical protein